MVEFEHLIREGKREIEGMGNDNTSKFLLIRVSRTDELRDKHTDTALIDILLL